MLYIWNNRELRFKRVKWVENTLYGIAGLIVLSFIVLSSVSPIRPRLSEQEIMVIVTRHNEFTSEKLIERIKDMHFTFPYIVYGQAILETDSFRSNIFRENNNLFGMKLAIRRLNVAKGSQYEHAFYDNWLDSLYDYGLYYATYLSQLMTEEEYYSYLSAYYAEDKQYTAKLKTLIREKNLKSMFN